MKVLSNVLALGGFLCLTVGPSMAQSNHASISPRAASATAARKVHGTVSGAPKLELEDGKWQYAVIVRSKGKMYEVQVDSHTNKVLNVEVTTKAEEAKEAVADAKAAHVKRGHK